MKNERRVELKPNFKKEIFSKFLKLYSYKKAAKLLGIHYSMIYHYKNNRVKTVPLKMINIIKDKLSLSDKDINANIINIISTKELRDKSLDVGRELRTKKIRRYFQSTISVTNMLKNESNKLYLDVIKWLEDTNWINKLKSQKGIIKNIEKHFSKNFIKLKYDVFSRKINDYQTYHVQLPKKLIIDIDFLYFFGLRFGDGTSGARIGVANKDYQLIEYTHSYLKNNFPTSKIYLDLNLHKNITNELKKMIIKKFKIISEDIRIYRNPDLLGDYVFSIYIVNRIFDRIMGCLKAELIDLFKLLTFEQKGAFLAGFFDAEGNVNKLDKNVRWSQKIKANVKLIKLLLEKEGYRVRYDGSNLIIAYNQSCNEKDLEQFKQQILPFIKHSEKRKETIELIDGYLVRDCYKPIVKIISENPNIIHRNIAKKINRRKCQRKLRALVNAGFVTKEGKIGESFKYKVTDSGLNWINKGD